MQEPDGLEGASKGLTHFVEEEEAEGKGRETGKETTRRLFRAHLRASPPLPLLSLFSLSFPPSSCLRLAGSRSHQLWYASNSFRPKRNLSRAGKLEVPSTRLSAHPSSHRSDLLPSFRSSVTARTIHSTQVEGSEEGGAAAKGVLDLSLDGRGDRIEAKAEMVLR